MRDVQEVSRPCYQFGRGVGVTWGALRGRKDQSGVHGALTDVLYRATLVSAGLHPHTAVLFSGLVECDPHTAKIHRQNRPVCSLAQRADNSASVMWQASKSQTLLAVTQCFAYMESLGARPSQSRLEASLRQCSCRASHPVRVSCAHTRERSCGDNKANHLRSLPR